MKICFLMLSHWSGTLGGAEIQVRYIMEYLRRETKHEIYMICRHTQMSEEEGTPIFRTRSPRFLGRYFKAADYLSVRELLEKTQPDVVYTRVSSPFVGFAAAYCRKYGKRLIYHIAHIEDVTPFRATSWSKLPKKLERPLYEYGLRRADVIIAQAQYQDELLRKHYGRGSSRVIQNFHPVPPDPIKGASIKTVLWVANIKARKRPELFIRLARDMRSMSDVRFVMVGDVQDPAYAQLVQTASEVGNLSYLGSLPVEEVNRLLESAHLFVNTSEASGEGFPNTFVQAWLRRVPVVSLEVNPDGILTRAGLGVCFDGNVAAMADGTAKLLRGESVLQSMGTSARQFAIAHYGVQNCRALVQLMETGTIRGQQS